MQKTIVVNQVRENARRHREFIKKYPLQHKLISELVILKEKLGRAGYISQARQV